MRRCEAAEFASPILNPILITALELTNPVRILIIVANATLFEKLFIKNEYSILKSHNQANNRMHKINMH